MNLHVHGKLTRDWALDEDFSEAEARTISRYDVAVDATWPGRPWRNKRYHHVVWGGPRLRDAYYARAVRERSLAHLGVALHIEQDLVGHGVVGSFVHWPALDRLDKRSARLRRRLEDRTRSMLRSYREELPRGRYLASANAEIPETPLPEPDTGAVT